MNQRTPAVLLPILRVYVNQAANESPGLVDAFYLTGSVALNGFNERLSDLDIVAAPNHAVTPSDFQSLNNVHALIKRGFLKCKQSSSIMKFSPGRK